MFSVPPYPGICLPYAFIRDDGQTNQHIGMTYRLKEHPDITVNLASNTPYPASTKSDGARPETVTNEYRTSDYWDQRSVSVHKFKTMWHRPFSTRPVKLSGQDGLASFVSVIREKGDETDYIYQAVARGNPETPETAPDVRLVVEQTRANAIKRNIQPLTQDEFLKLAEAIAASVAVRPVK